MQKIGITVPCYNEEPTVKLFYKAMQNVFNEMRKHGMHYDYEYLFVNDGSSDNTLNEIKDICKQNPEHVHYISFSRNFGKESAMAAGLSHVKGDYVAVLDADLQDPPELIPKMLKYIKNDHYDCVGCMQVGRHQPFMKRLFSSAFYKLFNKLSKIQLTQNVRDYRLMNRQYLDTFLSLPEYNRFTKGIFSWIGFRVKYLKFKSRKRVAGHSHWSLGNLFEYSLEAFIDFSDIPLRLSTFIGGFSCFLAIVGMIYAVIRKIIFGDSVAGWASLVSIFLLIGGIQLFCLGIIGKYIGKIYLETKHRPLYIIKEEK